MAEKPIKLKPQHEIVVNELAKGVSQTDAYLQAYPNVTRETARVNASRLLTNANIFNAVQNRIQQALANAKVTPEEVVGSAVRQMRSSIDDVLDENGSFDIEKARATGAIDLLKKYEETVKRVTDKDGNTVEVKTTKIELLTNQDGRKEVAVYLGLDKTPFKPPKEWEEEGFAREFFCILVVEQGWSVEDALEGVEQQFPNVDLKLLADGK